MSILSLCDGLPWILLKVDTRCTYSPPPNVYTKTPVKLLPHLFLRKMDWLSHTYLASFIQHVSIFIQGRRWHMTKNRIKSVPDRWERAKSGKRDASCNNLILDHDLRTKAKQPATSLYQKMSPGSWCELLQLGSDLFLISVWLILMAFLGTTVKAESSSDI